MSVVSHRALVALALTALHHMGAQATEQPFIAQPDLIALDDAYSAPPAPTSFAQLSNTPPAAATPKAREPHQRAAAAPSGEDANALWLTLAGIASMGFIARRHRRSLAPTRMPSPSSA